MPLTEDLLFLALCRTWQPVANAADLPRGKVIGYTLLDTELVMARFESGALLAADVARTFSAFREGASRCRAN